MAIFSPSARQLIDRAVANTADASRRQLWHEWVAANPDVRQPGEDWRAAAQTLPFELVTAAIHALEEMAKWKRRELEKANLSDDEISLLDNDLSHIRSVEKFLVHAAQEQERS
jgi:DNA repair ATPase RecN